MISVLILTLNEEVNIADCIASLPCSPGWRDDIHVLDSGSVDRTVAIAKRLGANVCIRAFTNYADQRNFGLALPLRHEWIVMLDADERMTAPLANEIERAISLSEPDTAMFRVRRRDMFMGRWLRRSSGYPTWFPRVLRRGRVTVKRAINETYEPNGMVINLSEHLVHHPLNKGMDWWFDRHCRYASAEATILANGEPETKLRHYDLVSRDAAKRRRILKHLAYRLPGRPFLTFFYLFFLRLGFLDGPAGYHFACMRMAYEIMIDSQAAHARRLRLNDDVAD